MQTVAVKLFEESIKASVGRELTFMVGRLLEIGAALVRAEKAGIVAAVDHCKGYLLKQCIYIRHEEKAWFGIYGLRLTDIVGEKANFDGVEIIRKISEWDCVEDINSKQAVALCNAVTTAAIRGGVV